MGQFKQCHTQSLQLCLNLCDHMDCNSPDSTVHGIFHAKYWSGLPFPSPGDLPDPVIKQESPRSPTLQANSLLLSHWGRTPCFSYWPPKEHPIAEYIKTCFSRTVLPFNYRECQPGLFLVLRHTLALLRKQAPSWLVISLERLEPKKAV